MHSLPHQCCCPQGLTEGSLGASCLSYGVKTLEYPTALHFTLIPVTMQQTQLYSALLSVNTGHTRPKDNSNVTGKIPGLQVVYW